MSKEEATQEVGVSKPGPRDEFLNKLAEKHGNLRNGEELEEVQEEDEIVEDESEEDEQDLVVLKVDGEEQQVERDKVLEAGIRALQKESTADKRLQEATELLKQAKEQQFSEKEESITLPSNDDEDLTASQLAQAIQYGDDDDVTSAINVLLQRRDNATSTVPDDVREELKQEARTEAALKVEFDNAVDRFKKEYSEIADDPMLMQVMINKEAQLRQEGDSRGYWELYDEIGKEINDWLDKKSPTESGLDKRRRKKESIDNVEGANAPVGKKQTPKPKSRKDLLNEMAKERGNY